MITTGLRVFVLLCVCFPVPLLAAYESSPPVYLSELLAEGLRQSVYHSVEEAHLQGRFYEFLVDTEFGTYVIPSLALLRVRVDEFNVLGRAINQFSRQNDQVSEQISGQLSISADSAMDIITRPVSSATNIAGQIARDINETLTGSPVVIPEKKTFDYSGNKSTDPVHAMHKRTVASQWGLDPYSSNRKVQSFLDAVARARSGGRISVGAPAYSKPRSSHRAIMQPPVEVRIAGALKSKDVSELNTLDEQMLAELHIAGDVRQEFLRHPVYSPRNKTRISYYLKTLDGVHDLGAFLRAALDVDSEMMALAFEETAMMLAYYHKNIQPLAKLYAGSDILQAIGTDNRIIFLAPLDIIFWDQRSETLFDGLLQKAGFSGFTQWEVIVAGRVTPMARAELEKRRFVVRARFAE